MSPLERASTVTVLAGGWSAAAIDKTRLPGKVIGVNDSAIHASCAIAVTMDRLWTEHRWDALCEIRRPTFVRRGCARHTTDRPNWLAEFECDHTSNRFSDRIGTLNGTNSGMCALNLAYQMRPRDVYLLGFDMGRGPNGETYWFPSYPWARPEGGTSDRRYAEWAKQFGPAALAFAGIGANVFVVGPSAIDVFLRMSIKDFERTNACNP